MDAWVDLLRAWGPLGLIPLLLVAFGLFIWKGLWPMMLSNQLELIDALKEELRAAREECARRENAAREDFYRREEKKDKQLAEYDKNLSEMALQMRDVAVVLASIDGASKRIEGRLERG